MFSDFFLSILDLILFETVYLGKCTNVQISRKAMHWLYKTLDIVITRNLVVFLSRVKIENYVIPCYVMSCHVKSSLRSFLTMQINLVE